MCRWDMQVPDPFEGGTGYAFKPTRWLTNCKALADVLEGVCPNHDGSKPWHRHVRLIGHGFGKITEQYPPKLVTAILAALRKQLRADGDISALEESVAGPVPNEPDLEYDIGSDDSSEEGQPGDYWDSVNGGWLQGDLVDAARQEEIEWMKLREVFEIVKADVCWQTTGKAPMTLRWVDTNKGDKLHPRYRSRLVAREI